MRKSGIFTLSAVLALGLAACSEQTQESAEDVAQSAGNDLETVAAQVGDAAQNSAKAVGDAAKDSARSAGAAAGAAVGDAASDAAAATNRLGKRIKQEGAELEARTQRESVEGAKAD